MKTIVLNTMFLNIQSPNSILHSGCLTLNFSQILDNIPILACSRLSVSGDNRKARAGRARSGREFALESLEQASRVHSNMYGKLRVLKLKR